MQAYGIKRYQLSGPDWLTTQRFDITAKIPEGTTKEQFLLMQQNLLADRFKLAVHYEKKEMQVYELQVGKNGSKMKESVETQPVQNTPNPPPAPAPLKTDKDGNPVLTSHGAVMMIGEGGARMTAREETMEQFVVLLAGQLGRPVTDATGLKGKYDFSLAYSPEGMAGIRIRPDPDGGPTSGAPDFDAPTIFGALQEQLGLKLEPKKGLVEMLVIDHMEKVPTEN